MTEWKFIIKETSILYLWKPQQIQLHVYLVTEYVSILNRPGHPGLLEKGRHRFSQMQIQWGLVTPSSSVGSRFSSEGLDHPCLRKQGRFRCS